MKPAALFICSSLFLACCNRNICPAAGTNAAQFKKYLVVVSDKELGRRFVYTEEYRQALNFLSSVTGIVANVDPSSIKGYDTYGDYKTDMQMWKRWYRKNHCKLTAEYVDSSFNKFGMR
jgi:hypothetical protein